MLNSQIVKLEHAFTVNIYVIMLAAYIPFVFKVVWIFILKMKLSHIENP